MMRNDPRYHRGRAPDETLFTRRNCRKIIDKTRQQLATIKEAKRDQHPSGRKLDSGTGSL